jgi:hypothetical protein
MIRERLACTAPELAALCALDRARRRRVVGWAMLVGERVVAYVPDHPRIAGGTLLNTYSSLDATDRLLAYADIRSVRDFSALLDRPAAP